VGEFHRPDYKRCYIKRSRDRSRLLLGHG
jgi:hypothetical protein